MLENKEMLIKNLCSTNGVMTVFDTDEFNQDFSVKKQDVIVHCTDFFPKDGVILTDYDGNKICSTEIKYNGVRKEVKSLKHRHTVHFVRNGVVMSTGDGAGNWDQPKFIVIEPYDLHQSEFANLSVSDSWINSSVKLSEKPIMLVREDCYNEIPNDQLNRYTIIKYSGNYSRCVSNIFKLINVEKEKRIDPNDPSHAHSFEYYTEKLLDGRNLFVNYLLDNKWDGKSPLEIDEKQLFCLFEIAKENNFFGYATGKKFTDIKSDDFEAMAIFLILSGIQITETAYCLKSEEEMLIDLKDIYYNGINKSNYFKMLEKYYSDDMEDYVDMSIVRYLDFCDKKVNQNKDITLEQIKDMNTSDLYKFNNNSNAKVVFNFLENFNMPPFTFSLCENGSKFDYYFSGGIYDCESVAKILPGELDINGNFSGTLQLEDTNVENLIPKFEFLSNVVRQNELAQSVDIGNDSNSLSHR